MRPFLLILALLAGSAASSQPNAELFDTSGMPRRPTTFAEQQIFEMIATHERGDLTDAARIHRRLGRYYAEKGDEERATAAFLAAAAAEKAAETKPADPGSKKEDGKQSATPPAPSVSARPSPSGNPPGAAFAGTYFGYDGRTLHTWEFRADGTFLHSWIASGAGTSVRNSERGVFRLSGDVLELRISSAASGFVTPGIGGRSTVAGGGAEESGEIRRVRFAKSAGGVVLDGIELKPKSW